MRLGPVTSERSIPQYIRGEDVARPLSTLLSVEFSLLRFVVFWSRWSLGLQQSSTSTDPSQLRCLY